MSAVFKAPFPWFGGKYRAQRTEVDGIVFDSKGEARRYGELTAAGAYCIL